MLKQFRNHSPFTVILLAIGTLLAKLQALTRPRLPKPVDGLLLYNWLLDVVHFFLGNSAFAYTLVAATLLFAQAIHLSNLAIRHRLFAKNTYLPAFAFLVLTSLHPAESYFSPALLTNWCIIGSLDLLLRLHQPESPRKSVFNIGFMLGVAVLLQPPLVLMMLWFFVAMALLRAIHREEWVIAGLGIFTPLYFFAALLYLTNQWANAKQYLNAFRPQVTRFAGTPLLFISVGGILALLALGFYCFRRNHAQQAITLRRSRIVLSLGLVAAAAVATLAFHSDRSAWTMLMPFAALIASAPLYEDQQRRFSTFDFCLFLALILACQLILSYTRPSP